VDFSRNQFFPSASLAQDQDGGICGRHDLDLFDDLPERCALTDNLAA
jgi:hypothetical protein